MVHRQESVAIEAASRGGGPDGGYIRSESTRTDASANNADNRSQGRGMVAMDGKKRQRDPESFAYKSIRNGQDEYKWWIEEAIGAGTVEIMRGANRQGESNSSNGNPLL